MTARWSATTKRAVVALFVVLAGYLVYNAGDIVRPFVWAGIVAYLLLPAVGALERRLSLPRTLAAVTVFLALLALIFGGGGRVLLPAALDQARDLQRSLPTLLVNAQNTITEATDQLGFEELDELIFSGGNAPDLGAMIARQAFPVAVGAAHFLLEFLIFLIATFFYLRDAPRLMDWIRGSLPKAHRHEIVPLLGDVNVLLGRYVRGQVFLIGVMWTATTIGLSLLGVPFSLLLGLVTGVLEVIPIVGPITAGAMASLVALGHPNPFGWNQLLYVGAVAGMYTVFRHAEDYFVIPLVIGRIVRLHPALVIFALLSGGALFGLLGILLAVPAAATLRLVLVYVGAKLRDEDPFPRLEEELAVAHAETVEAHQRQPVGGRAHP